MTRQRCYCDYCPCDDPADPLQDTAEDGGPPLCWNCAIGQHHTCDFFWCPPEHYAHWNSL